ncbi:MAG: homoaconitase [Longimicrobiales bacterium]
MGATVVEKIARAHMVEDPDRPLRPGDMVVLRPRHILTHDNTAPVMGKFRSIGVDRVADPRQPVVVLDHDIQNRSEANLEKYTRIRTFCRDQGLDFHPAGTGIGHQIMVERGYAQPGWLVVASDSHANTYGAVGALGTPVVRTDAAAIWATGEFWWSIPRTVQVVLEGELRPGVSGKDLILTLCGLYNQGEVLNAAVEFAGPGVASLDMAARMTVANMTTEWGALVGWFPVDDITIAYLRERKARLEAAEHHRISKEDLAAWAAHPPAPDRDADYAARITVDLSEVTPYLAGPDSVQVARSVIEAEDEEIAIQKAYLLSCVNGRLEDLETAAAVVRGRRVAEGVELYVAAASREIQEKAETSGAWTDLLEAGAIPLPPGCGPCIGLGAGLLEPDEVAVSATNRNFKGRMGSRDARVYLASPAVVARSALAGRITARNGGAGVDVGGEGAPSYALETLETPAPAADDVAIMDGFPESVTGRLVFVPRENLNTDGIYGKDHTYQDRTPEEMAEVVMANYDPSFADRVEAGDILVGTRNFGTGSSREQAATALQAKGIELVIAGSLSQTYQRNAFNNGFICVECPSLVQALEAELADEVEAGERTIIPGDELTVDFRRGQVSWRGERHRFPPLDRVPQALVVAGGVEAQVRERRG